MSSHVRLYVIFMVGIILSTSSCGSNQNLELNQDTASIAQEIATEPNLLIKDLTSTTGFISVARGTTVTWINNDSTSQSVTSTTGVWDSGRLNPGESFQYKFDQPGTYEYLSVFDVDRKGRIVVQDLDSQNLFATTNFVFNNPYRPNPSGPPTALNRARALSKLNLALIPDWSQYGDLQKIFQRIRDERFLQSPDQSHFLRRIAWIYPDSGCYARAAVASQKLETWGYRRPAKLFVFGPLRVFTPNGIDGKADWFYHVAPAVRFQGQVFVIDAAIDPLRPLPINDWIGHMVRNPDRVQIAVCNPFAYMPSSQCYVSGPSTEDDAYRDHGYFLRQELRRIVTLQRNADEELGDRPPWLNNISAEDGSL